MVKGQALDEAQRAFSVTEFRRDEIREQPRQEVESLWSLVPGMHVNHYQLSGVANGLVLRGFGGGGHGGDVAATLDGIPLNEAMSHADGYFDLNVVVPLELDQVNVYRGPVSVLQGNYNRAGLLELRTRRSGSYAELDVSAGSHGMFDAQAALGRELEGAISSIWRPSIRAVMARGPLAL
jgi:outer membrane receptor protein involved in Fe transport